MTLSTEEKICYNEQQRIRKIQKSARPEYDSEV